MDRALVYYLSLLLMGCMLGISGLSGIISRDPTITLVLMAIGGTSVALGSVHTLLVSDDPFDSVPEGGWAWWAVVLGAALAVVGQLLLFVG